ncbi:MAG TPA: YCF48-related protein [Treponemataceae bacterium]|nr:YCF48-related protein [Treponemataceae bacterium]
MQLSRVMVAALILTVSLSGCAQWKEKVQTENQHDMLYTGMFIDKAHALAVGRAGITRHSIDSGKKWLGGTNSSMCLYGCNALDEKTYFATGNKKQVIISTNGGDSWSHATNIGGSAPLGKSISFSNVKTGWASSKNWLGETTDGGRNWTEMPLPPGASFVETICATGPGTGYLVSEMKEVFQTSDSGAHWNKLASPFAELKVPFRPLFSRDNQGVALYMTGDSGILASVGTIDKRNILLIAETKDGGKTWSTPELHKLKRLPRSVSVSAKGYVSVFNKDESLTAYAR